MIELVLTQGKNTCLFRIFGFLKSEIVSVTDHNKIARRAETRYDACLHAHLMDYLSSRLITRLCVSHSQTRGLLVVNEDME